MTDAPKRIWMPKSKAAEWRFDAIDVETHPDGWPVYIRADVAQQQQEPTPEAVERAAVLRDAALFLKDRLDEWQNENLTDEGARDWCGHVEPAIARLLALTAPA